LQKKIYSNKLFLRQYVKHGTASSDQRVGNMTFKKKPVLEIVRDGRVRRGRRSWMIWGLDSLKM